MSSQNIYINTIDECVNNIIDSFYLEILENKQFKKDLKTKDFILNHFDEVLSKVNKLVKDKSTESNVGKIITNVDEYNKVINLFTDYVLLYFFFYVGVFDDLNKIMDLLNKLSNKHKINFFKNRYLTQYSLYYKYINDYKIVLDNYPNKNDDKDYTDVIESIKLIDEEVLKNIIGNKQDLIHNILKIIIFREIYIKDDKVMIFKLLENEEMANADFKYIEIVDSRYETIDYAMIESLFDINDVKEGLAEEIFKMINDYESIKIAPDYSIDTKINQMFKNKVLIPITDEFLRFHKDTEMYDKSVGSKIDPKDKVIKKGDTKIRYIVTKINKVKDYYSTKVMSDPTLKTDIEKNFYQPLLYRKAIIINDLEEINILKKLELQGKSVTESNEFYEDLKQIRLYPYIEFKSSNRDYFSFSPDTTIEAIRYCNFEFKNDTRFPNIGNYELQSRVINNTTKSNILGVAIPRFNLADANDYNKYNQTLIACHATKDTTDMTSIYKNAFKVTLKKLRKLFTDDKRYSKILYWLFDRKSDVIKLDLFDNINQLSRDDYIKILLGKVYDEMTDLTYSLVINQINLLTNINYKEARDILKYFENKLVLIPRHSRRYDELMKLIHYMKVTASVNSYDENEDKIPGVTSKLIVLPSVILEEIAVHIIRISKEELFVDKVDDSDMYDGYTCQHIITWNNIMRFKKSNPNKFNQELYNFIKIYVTPNDDGDFVCKSCYQLVDLRKYTTEIFPGSESIAVSYGLEMELETIPEYVKYTKAIKNIDKMLEKVCYASNIAYFVGAGQQVKFRRQEIIKNMIDIIDMQFKTLFSKDTNSRKERLENSIKKYGCSMTNFFLFKLDNDIFTYSSKEIDKFKLYKIDNIITYMLITLVNEINLSQIIFLSFDKLVNYFLFTKFGFNLFNDLYIRVSNKNDVAPIKNYKLLCYIIYYITGVYAKYNMWYADGITFKPNNINPQIQRIAIHTFVDALNSILEVNTKESSNYLYNMFSTKFFNKLNNVYNNTSGKDVLDKLELQNKQKVVITIDKKLKYNISTVEPIPFVSYNTDGSFIIKSVLGTKTPVTTYPSVEFMYDKLNDKTSLDVLGEKKIEEISNRLFMETLQKIATLYDSDGIKRNISINLDDAKKLSIDELKKITKSSKDVRINSILKTEKIVDKKLEKIEMKNIKNEKYLEQIVKKFNDEISHTIEAFISKIESLIGNDININNNNYYLRYDAYELDHDYRGNKKSSIIITEKDQKIKYKKNDTFFGQDVYQYDDANNQVSVFYSATEKYLIGYKESSKDYIKIFNSNCYIKVHYSLKHQITYLGFTYMNYVVPPKNDNINEFVNNILRIRLQNLKNSLSTIQQIIYQVKNNFAGTYVNPIAKYYQNKIKIINTYDEDGERIFKDWMMINDNLYYHKIDVTSNINVKTLPNKQQYLSVDILNKFITNDDVVIHYIIEQLTMLLDINNDNYTKVNLAYMIINIIFQLFRDLNNFENAFFDINVKKFYNYIISKAEVSDVHDEVVDTSGMSEEEIEQFKDKQDQDKEQLDALDADQDETNEDFGDEDVVILDRVSGDY
jgi:hypothetical protein